MSDSLTVLQAATRLGIHPSLVARYCAQGRLQAEKPGRDWQIDPADFARFERVRRQVGRPPSQPPASGA